MKGASCSSYEAAESQMWSPEMGNNGIMIRSCQGRFYNRDVYRLKSVGVQFWEECVNVSQSLILQWSSFILFKNADSDSGGLEEDPEIWHIQQASRCCCCWTPDLEESSVRGTYLFHNTFLNFLECGTFWLLPPLIVPHLHISLSRWSMNVWVGEWIKIIHWGVSITIDRSAD